MTFRLIAGLACCLLLAGCRGMISQNPPIHPNQNMDYQEKFEPQEANPFFADNAAMRTPVPGTVARGFLRDDAPYVFGRNPDGTFVQEMPVALTREMLERGQERYEIYCTPCHGQTGDGQGIIMTGNYGYVPAPSYHQDIYRTIEDGHLYNVIANGIRNMPAYGFHLPVADRWAIVAYVRALQRSQYAGESDVPDEVLGDIENISPNVGG